MDKMEQLDRLLSFRLHTRTKKRMDEQSWMRFDGLKELLEVLRIVAHRIKDEQVGHQEILLDSNVDDSG